MKVLSIDVFICVDTRHKESSNRAYTKQVQQVLPGFHSPIAAHKSLKWDKFCSSVGGQLIILSAPWAEKLVDTYHDPSNFGLVSGATLQAGEGKILILGNYWPFSPSTSKANLGLWSRIALYLKKSRAKDPHDYIKSSINGKAENNNSKSLHNYTIVCGDFNHSWNTGKYQLQQWVENNNWAAPSITHVKDKKEYYYTYFAKTEATSWIDHLLIAPATAASVVLSTTFFKGNL